MQQLLASSDHVDEVASEKAQQAAEGFAVDAQSGWKGGGRPAVVEGLSSGEMRAFHRAWVALQPEPLFERE